MSNKSRIIKFNKISLREKKIIIDKLYHIFIFALYTILINLLYIFKKISIYIYSFLFIVGFGVLCFIIFTTPFVAHDEYKDNKFLKALDFRMKCPENCTRK